MDNLLFWGALQKAKWHIEDSIKLYERLFPQEPQTKDKPKLPSKIADLDRYYNSEIAVKINSIIDFLGGGE